MVEKCKLPAEFKISEYLHAFKQLAPISGVNEEMDDNTVIYVANCAFAKYCDSLQKAGVAKQKDTTWTILSSEKTILAHMNVMPIAIHSGANIVFVDSFN